MINKVETVIDELELIPVYDGEGQKDERSAKAIKDAVDLIISLTLEVTALDGLVKDIGRR